MAEQPIQPARSQFTQIDEFSVSYANNVLLEASEWDLKLVFGQLDLSTGTPNVEQHTAITIPWLQAKLLHYFLGLNVALFEYQNGKIKIPLGLLPPAPPPLTPEQEADPAAKKLFDLAKKVHQEFTSTL